MGAKKKEPNPRRGRVAKDADKPAAHEAGGAAGPAFFDPEPIMQAMDVYWKHGVGDQFLIQGEDGRWASWNKQAMIDHMLMVANGMGLSCSPKRREGEPLAETVRVVYAIRRTPERVLDEVFNALPGYPAGIKELESGEKVLVKTAPKIPVPVAGGWANIKELIDGRLDLSKDGGIDQTPWFHSWCKVALEALMQGQPGHWRAGHAMILTGPAGCGKNRLQENLITILLGGRYANPTKFLFDGDEFNGDVFAAEHLLLGEVPLPSQKSVDRNALAERIKQVVANSAQRMRLMRTEPWTVFPYWRLTISINDDPQKLRSLPLITSDFGDKVLIFHCAAAPLPLLKGDSIAEQRTFRETIAAEVPAYAHWLLNEWQVPENLLTYDSGRSATRFGFREFHHPVIKGELFDDTPAAQLLNLIDMAEFTGGDWEDFLAGPRKLWQVPSAIDREHRDYGGVWHGRAESLQQLLTGEGGCASSVATMAKKLFAHNSCSRMLSPLAADEVIGAERVAKADTRNWKGWRIAPPVRKA